MEFFRKLKAVKKRGVEGIIHQNKGKPSNNTPVPIEKKQTIVTLATTKYEGFGATLLCEKLRENENICYSKETIRKTLLWGNVYQEKIRYIIINECNKIPIELHWA